MTYTITLNYKPAIRLSNAHDARVALLAAKREAHAIYLKTGIRIRVGLSFVRA